jgi:hypothetical protein
MYENLLQNQKKREIEFEVGTYIKKLNGVSDERWSRGGELQELIATQNWKVTSLWLIAILNRLGFHERDLSGARRRSGARKRSGVKKGVRI